MRGYNDLQMLPLVAKEHLQGTPAGDLVARGVDPTTLLARRTNGTTGEPLAIWRTPAELRLLNLYYFQAFRSLGVHRRDTVAGVRLPRPGSIPASPGVPRRFANLAGIYPRADLIAENPLLLLDELKRISPAVIGGVPGLLSRIAAQWPPEDTRTMRTSHWPRLVVTGGERLTQAVRSHLTETFGARVIDMYSSMEFYLIASECVTTGAYHVSDETVALEILDGERTVESGAAGQPVGTALHSFAAPIIRYPLGDVVTMGGESCDCGVRLSTISEIQGRLMTYLELPDGMIVHDNKIEEAVGYAADWVRQTQVSQPRADMITLRIAPLRDPSPEEVGRLSYYLEKFLRNQVTVEVVIDRELGLGGGEKLRALIPLRHATSTGRRGFCNKADQ